MNRLWARLMRPWREAAAIIAEAETAGWRKPPAREITFPPVPPPPGPPWNLASRHGGHLGTFHICADGVHVETVDLWADGRLVIVRHITGEHLVFPGYCADCGRAIGAEIDALLRELLQ